MISSCADKCSSDQFLVPDLRVVPWRNYDDMSGDLYLEPGNMNRPPRSESSRVFRIKRALLLVYGGHRKTARFNCTRRL